MSKDEVSQNGRLLWLKAVKTGTRTQESLRIDSNGVNHPQATALETQIWARDQKHSPNSWYILIFVYVYVILDVDDVNLSWTRVVFLSFRYVVSL